MSKATLIITALVLGMIAPFRAWAGKLRDTADRVENGPSDSGNSTVDDEHSDDDDDYDDDECFLLCLFLVGNILIRIPGKTRPAKTRIRTTTPW